MRIVRKILIFTGKSIACIAAIAILAVAATSFSPVYDFRAPRPFQGKDIFNPYECLDTNLKWKRANFHTHTRVEGILNECDFSPEEVYRILEDLGYDIVTFSNHNELTEHPFDPSLQVNVYEHGYNLFKYHKLVFGSGKTRHYDHLLPIFAFQKQHQLDYLSKDSDLIQINHPLRTSGLPFSQLEKLSGYRLIELDSGKSTENTYWDIALSAGHYCYGTANDDLHYPDISSKTAVRCNFLCCPSAEYEDIRKTLTNGCFYSMRVPDYGHGDWEIKREKNKKLPRINNIGLKDSLIYLSVSEVADSIKVTGQHHKVLLCLCNTDRVEYQMKSSDNYARITIYFPGGEVIYTNPFARYDSETADSPFDDRPQETNILFSILYNIAVTLVCLLACWAITMIWKRKK